MRQWKPVRMTSFPRNSSRCSLQELRTLKTRTLANGARMRHPAFVHQAAVTLDTYLPSALGLTMEINLSPELLAKLAQIAAANNSDAADYVSRLVEHYIDHDAWFRQKVKEGLSQLDRGEFVTHEEIGARIDQIFRP